METNWDVLIEEAKLFAYYAHAGQYRKCDDGKTKLYISHPLTVMEYVKAFGGTKEDQIVACLHDVIEDCASNGYGYNEIKYKFGEKIADRVLNLTDDKVDSMTGKYLQEQEWKDRKRDIQYNKFLKMSDGDQLVKACDQLHNMGDYREVGVKNIVYRESYVQKAYDLIMAGRNFPLELKVHTRAVYNDSKDFFKENKGQLRDNPKFLRRNLNMNLFMSRDNNCTQRGMAS